ncbi:MAG: L,D-transpeptidase [Cyanothece sp. SIO2G6]|nr:L,D-transpeptidase [Cyanothece sp. SIO2G6]
MPRRVTTNSPSRQVITRPTFQYNSAVAQAFMILSFMSAGLLLSVQLIYENRSIAQTGESDPMATASSSSVSLSSDPSLPDSLTFATSALQVPQTSAPGAESPQDMQDTTVMPSATEIFQFLTRFSVLQDFIGWAPVEREQVPNGGPATLIPPFLLISEGSIAPLVPQVFPQGEAETSVGNTQTAPPQNSKQDITLRQTAQTITPGQPEDVALEQATVQLVVDLSDRQLTLYEQDTVIYTYPIAVGKTGWETPVGEFVVTDKDPMPTWRHPLTGELVPAGADSPLGTRWIGFWSDGIHQIGFHGTNQAQSIGQAISHGCIRLQNSDIETLYTKVIVGTPILIQP